MALVLYVQCCPHQRLSEILQQHFKLGLVLLLLQAILLLPQAALTCSTDLQHQLEWTVSEFLSRLELRVLLGLQELQRPRERGTAGTAHELQAAATTEKEDYRVCGLPREGLLKALSNGKSQPRILQIVH